MQNDHLWERGRISVILNLLIEFFLCTKYFTEVDHNKEISHGRLFQHFSFLKSYEIHLQCCVWNGLSRRVVESSFKVHLCVANGEIINAR